MAKSAELRAKGNPFSNFLGDFKLQKYTETLIEAGYDDFDCFDFEYSDIEDLLNDLVNTVNMRKPHAQKLLAQLRNRLADVNTQTTYQQDRGLDASSVHPGGEEQMEVAKMKIEQMEVAFNARLDKRFAEERIARERMDQEHIARLTDERAAIKKEIELESTKAAVKRTERKVAISTGDLKEGTSSKLHATT